MPNILDLAFLNLPRNTYLVRQERVKREGSRYYTWTPGVIATTALEAIYIPDQFPDSRKYQPLDWLEIMNNEAANDLTLTMNGNETLPVPHGSIRTVRNKPLWHVQVTNNGGVNTTAGLIIITLRKEPLTIDQWARKQS